MDVKKMGAFDSLQFGQVARGDGRFPLESDRLKGPTPDEVLADLKAEAAMHHQGFERMTREEALRRGLVPMTPAQLDAMQRMLPNERARFAKRLLGEATKATLESGKRLADVHHDVGKTRNKRKAERQRRRDARKAERRRR